MKLVKNDRGFNYHSEDWKIRVCVYEMEDGALMWRADKKVYDDYNNPLGVWETLFYAKTIYEADEKLQELGLV